MGQWELRHEGKWSEPLGSLQAGWLGGGWVNSVREKDDEGPDSYFLQEMFFMTNLLLHTFAQVIGTLTMFVGYSDW